MGPVTKYPVTDTLATRSAFPRETGGDKLRNRTRARGTWHIHGWHKTSHYQGSWLANVNTVFGKTGGDTRSATVQMG